ncbi:MAG: hypothetical protein NZ533_10225 [Casimicrobiaceae bacterium]|nr:hypothetical protein [Casimicrobiaceae bacterium]MDW8312019.1 hypothetical protein [Burkholderiales bacterium]
MAEALDVLISRSQRSLCVLDLDLRLQGWERKARIEALRQSIVERSVRVRILVADLRYLESHLARLAQLAADRSGHIEIVESDRTHELSTAFAVADGQHGLVRPDPLRSRGLAWFENLYKSNTYEEIFESFWNSGGRRYFPETLGL